MTTFSRWRVVGGRRSAGPPCAQRRVLSSWWPAVERGPMVGLARGYVARAALVAERAEQPAVGQLVQVLAGGRVADAERVGVPS